MRGTILSFSGSEGVISHAGTQYPFRLDQWKSDQPPKAGQSVEFTLSENAIASVTLIDTTQVVEEKARVALQQAKTLSLHTYQDAGKAVTLAYGFFALFALFADTVRNVPVTLPGLVNGFSWGDLVAPSGLNGGFGLLLVVLAILSIAVPAFWRHPAAPLAWTLPLIVTIIGIYHLYTAISDISSFAGAFDQNAGSEVRSRAFDALTMWFWLTFFISIYLAVMGYLRFQKNRKGATA